MVKCRFIICLGITACGSDINGLKKHPRLHWNNKGLDCGWLLRSLWGLKFWDLSFKKYFVLTACYTKYTRGVQLPYPMVFWVAFLKLRNHSIMSPILTSMAVRSQIPSLPHSQAAGMTPRYVQSDRFLPCWNWRIDPGKQALHTSPILSVSVVVDSSGLRCQLCNV